MFDEEFRPMLIEVNSNPSLEPSNNNLVKLFTCMLDNTFRIAIEPIFPPSEGYSLKKGSIGIETCPENRFDLIFDERVDGADLLKKFERIGKKELQELQSINELEGSEDESNSEEQIKVKSCKESISNFEDPKPKTYKQKRENGLLHQLPKSNAAVDTSSTIKKGPIPQNQGFSLRFKGKTENSLNANDKHQDTSVLETGSARVSDLHSNASK